MDPPTSRHWIDADPIESRQQQGEQGRPSSHRLAREILPALARKEIPSRRKEIYSTPFNHRAIGGGTDEDVGGAQPGDTDDEQGEAGEPLLPPPPIFINL